MWNIVNDGHQTRQRSRSLTLGALAALALAAAPGIPMVASASGTSTSLSFTTAGCSTWTVPTGVSSVRILATGSAGSAGTSHNGVPSGAGGLGDGVSGTLAGLVGGTQILDVCVAQGGGTGHGFGAAGGNGGGASGVSLGSDFSSPVLVAGGGGGGGGADISNAPGGNGGSAGTPTAQPGASAAFGHQTGGGGGTQAAGGAGGVNIGSSAGNSQPGGQFTAAGPGPGGSSSGQFSDGGGGGGAGYYGGGAGGSGSAAGAGGGGGSDFCAAVITGCTVSSGAGTQTTAGSGAGQAQVTFTYTLADTTPPTTTINLGPTSPSGQNGWYTSAVAVTVTATDPDDTGGLQTRCVLDPSSPPSSFSALPSTDCPFLSPGASVSTDGSHTIYAASQDPAGNMESIRSSSFKIDNTAPLVTYTGNAGSYTVDQEVQISCAASDMTSGVASTTCQSISGPAYSFGLGTHSYSASALDNAGNQGNGTTGFTVSVNSSSLQTLAGRFCTDPGVAASLEQDITHIASAPNANVRAGALQGFTNLVRAQTGKSLTSAQANTLVTLANAL